MVVFIACRTIWLNAKDLPARNSAAPCPEMPTGNQSLRLKWAQLDFIAGEAGKARTLLFGLRGTAPWCQRNVRRSTACWEMPRPLNDSRNSALFRLVTANYNGNTRILDWRSCFQTVGEP